MILARYKLYSEPLKELNITLGQDLNGRCEFNVLP